MVRQTSKWGQSLLLILVSVGAFAIATSWYYRLDEVITTQGKLVPRKGGVEVKSPTNGQLEEIYIKNGEDVVKGQLLLRFDVKSAKASEKALSEQINLESKRIKDQLSSNDKRQEAAKRNAELTKRIITRLKPLQLSGAISELQILQEENRLETQRDEIIQLKQQRLSLNNDSLSRKSRLRAELERVQSQLRNELVKAPINGTVFDIQPDNNRYVATNAEPLLKIIPRGKLAGQVNVSNKDIGFIRTGQEVKVRVDSFPYTEYGEINGEISQVGADALPPNETIRNYHFPITLKLNRSNLETKDGSKIPLQAGMTITTNLKLRDRRLIELLGDLFNDRGESMKRLRQP